VSPHADAANAHGPRVVFVLSMFPCYDEAFLLREIHAVAERIDVWVFSLRRSRDRIVHHEAVALRARVLHAPLLAIVNAHVRLLARRPRRCLAALARLIIGRASRKARASSLG